MNRPIITRLHAAIRAAYSGALVLALALALASFGAASAEDAAAQPVAAVEQLPRGQEVSDTVIELAGWVAATKDAQGYPFAIMDKAAAQILVFGGDGRLRGAAPGLFGSAVGDHSAPGIAGLALREIPGQDRTTPAGRFVGGFGPSTDAGRVLWVDYDSAVSMHPTATGIPAERRAERLASPSPNDNRVTHGCINVSPEFLRADHPSNVRAGRGVLPLPQAPGSQHHAGPVQELRRDEALRVILLLSIFFALNIGTGGLGSVVRVFGQMILFFALALLFGIWLLPLLVRWVRGLPISQNVLSLSIIVLLGFSIAAELIGGMAAITGAFITGLMLARSGERERVEQGVHALAYGLFVPIFFVSIGLSVNARNLEPEMIVFTLVIILAAILGKWVGAGAGARLGGFNLRESVQLGAGMISRGEVGLIVAGVGITEGMVSSEEFSAVVAMVLVTTVVTPPILRWLFARKNAKAANEPHAADNAPDEVNPKNEETN